MPLAPCRNVTSPAPSPSSSSASGGWLDLLLQEAETKSRYEVEIQLGPTDPSHIIRTIEYWDIERKRYPKATPPSTRKS